MRPRKAYVAGFVLAATRKLVSPSMLLVSYSTLASTAARARILAHAVHRCGLIYLLRPIYRCDSQAATSAAFIALAAALVLGVLLVETEGEALHMLVFAMSFSILTR